MGVVIMVEIGSALVEIVVVEEFELGIDKLPPVIVTPPAPGIVQISEVS